MTKEEKQALYESVIRKAASLVKQKIEEGYNIEELLAEAKQIVQEAIDDSKEVVVFTGKSAYFEGDKVEKFIEKNTNFKTSHTVNKKISLIITGNKPGPNKLEKAKELGIEVMSEDAFYDEYGLTDKLP